MNLRGEKEVKRRRWKEEDRFCKFIHLFIYYFFMLIWIVVYGALILVYNYYDELFIYCILLTCIIVNLIFHISHIPCLGKNNLFIYLIIVLFYINNNFINSKTWF